MKLTKFKYHELKIIGLVLLVLFVVSGINMGTSLRRGRDNQRKNDMSTLQKALDLYFQKYHVFPQATDDGRIVGCFTQEVQLDKKTGQPINATACDWSRSSFENIKVMPRDPRAKDGFEYRYFSNGKRFQLYISLEGKDEAEYMESVNRLNLQCGTKVCNYGRGYGDTPVDIKLEDIKDDTQI